MCMGPCNLRQAIIPYKILQWDLLLQTRSDKKNRVEHQLTAQTDKLSQLSQLELLRILSLEKP